eukprot:3535422-Rhodomonas_salina.2
MRYRGTPVCTDPPPASEFGAAVQTHTRVDHVELTALAAYAADTLSAYAADTLAAYTADTPCSYGLTLASAWTTLSSPPSSRSWDHLVGA